MWYAKEQRQVVTENMQQLGSRRLGASFYHDILLYSIALRPIKPGEAVRPLGDVGTTSLMRAMEKKT